MSQPYRTHAGGRIDRAQPIHFRFDGRAYTGCAGDSLASALLAHGVHLVGRSFKYHRPRGIMAAGADEPNALVQVGATPAHQTPNLRATQVEIYPGLHAVSQNRFPSLAFDLGAINDFLAPFLPAGFYYKTFMWPRWGWHRLYEPAIRSMAGLGRAPVAPDADHYAQRYAHCDVLIVGAGPAGLAAAGAAVAAGAKVILCDEQAELGGALLSEPVGSEAGIWLAARQAELGRNQAVTLLPRTTAFGIFAQNFAALAERVTDHLAMPDPAAPRERLWQVRARQIVLATGALERPMLFSGNDRPGIMLSHAARTYLHRYGVNCGTRVVLTTETDDAYKVALELQQAGSRIAAIADARPCTDGPWEEAARSAGLRIIKNCHIHQTYGRRRVRRVLLAAADGRQEAIDCDLVLMSGGFTPTVHLFSQARGSLAFDASIGAFVPVGDDGLIQAAGACGGRFNLEAAVADGAQAGHIAAARCGFGRTQAALATAAATPATPTPAHKRLHANARAFVDFQNDVTTKDIELAVREGFHSVEHVKRYTTVGMATDQGKTSNINALELVAQARAISMQQAGLTTFRMPYTPITFGTLAGCARGDLFDPVRQTPLHHWAAQNGAVFEDVGQWKRARYFPRTGESMAASVARECRSVRSAAGIFDASTLGKIEVVGPDAAIFLDRMYINNIRKMLPGQARYGIMLREDGFILDDGIIARLRDESFHVTTTTGGAARVLAMMEDYLQTEWPDLRVWLTATTEEWAVIAVQGPAARDIIAPLVEGIDCAAAALPHMSVAEGRICGVRLRLFRVSFTGELGFELNVPADYAPFVWNAVLAAGAPLGLAAYGTEAMHVLRAEKGYIIIGQESDGTVTPDDLGLGWAIARGKGDFVGKRSLARAGLSTGARKQLVGLLTDDPTQVLEEGAQITAFAAGAVPRPMLGHVTSGYFSPALNRSIALALVANGRSMLGSTLYVPMADRAHAVRLTSPVFYDPQAGRLHG